MHYKLYILVILAQVKVVITADQSMRSGRAIDLKYAVDEAVAQCPSVEYVFVYQRTGAEVPMGKKDLLLEQVSRLK